MRQRAHRGNPRDAFDFRLPGETIRHGLHGVRLVGLVFEVNFHFRWVSGVI